ncbi:MAG: ABC transporter permease [Phycisphaerae bacterium]|nr:ABC transporter permease [Phycisphaerae bacterium]
MPKVLQIAWREYKATVKTKGFIIGLLLAPVLMSGGFIAMIITEKKVDITDRRIAVIDHTSQIAPAVVEAAKARNENEIHDPRTGAKIKPAYLITVIEPAADARTQRLEMSNRIRAKQLDGFVEIGPSVVHPSENAEGAGVHYYCENVLFDEVRNWMGWPVNNQLRKLRLASAGIDEERVPDLFHWTGVQSMGLVTVNAQTGQISDAQRPNELQAVAGPVVMVMLMFMMIMMGAVPLLQSVMEEKNQRIAEVLIASVRPFEFMMGKVLGGLAVALTASSVYIIGGAATITRMGLAEYLPYDLLPWFFVYMLLAIIMFGSNFAAVGSACSDAKDAQTLTLPAMLPVMVPMFLLGPILKHPTGPFATVLSLLPPFTPTLMMMRQSSSMTIPAWQPWAGLAGIVVFTLLSVWAGGRIFRVAILTQGKPPRLTTLLRWAIRG